MEGDFRPHAEHDSESDAIYVWLIDEPARRSVQIDDCRTIDYSEDRRVVGIEFLGVGGGIDLSDIPFRHTVEQLIGDLGLGIKIFA